MNTQMVGRTNTDFNANSSASSNLIEAIELLHSFVVSAADIARRLHVDQANVLNVIQTGQQPARQLPLLWADEPKASPYEQETSR
ncbi:MAG: hypothetical protein GY903_03310 [Fuerstiella sp.]|nr:hypothetical protein [Fuerstiella sp.]MCP4853503.1 hypothetical protein [Fuerstiella sp.]